jgi:hypothetical protein
LVRQTRKVSHQQTTNQILEANALQKLIVVYVEKFPNVVEHFGRVVHEDFTDLFYRLLVAFIDELVIVFAVEILFIELEQLIEFVIVRFKTPPDSSIN